MSPGTTPSTRSIAQGRETLALLAPLSRITASRGLTYAPGKWTLKEVVGHLADDERIFVYRALCIARGDPAPLPGFDENDYVAAAGFEARASPACSQEFRDRAPGVVLASSRPPAGGLAAARHRQRLRAPSARGLAFHIAGHELHHRRTLREKYLRLS